MERSIEYSVYVLTAPGLAGDLFFGAYGEKSEAQEAAVVKFDKFGVDRWSVLELDAEDVTGIVRIASGEEV